jgi:hypothetical protein
LQADLAHEIGRQSRVKRIRPLARRPRTVVLRRPSRLARL